MFKFVNKEEEQKMLSTKLATVASDYAGVDDDYAEIAKKAQQKESEFRINIYPASDTYGANSYELQVTDKDGSITNKAITESQFKYLSGRKDVPVIVNDNLDRAIKVFGKTTGSTNQQYSYMDPTNASSTAFVKA